MKLFQRITSYIKFLFKAKPLIGHGIHSPFVYYLASVTLRNAKKNKQLLKNIEAIRNELILNNNSLIINDLGAGKKSGIIKRSVSSIAKKSLSTPKQCRMLYALTQEANPKTILELGTSLGISTMAMAIAAYNTKIYTIEGSAEIANIAKMNYEKAGLKNINSYVGNFDAVLPSLLPALEQPILAYIDGNHSYEATLRYFEILLPKVDEHSVLIFDDIHWSSGMEQAWEAICKHPKVVVSIDLFQVGLVFFRNGMKKQHFLIRY